MFLCKAAARSPWKRQSALWFTRWQYLNSDQWRIRQTPGQHLRRAGPSVPLCPEHRRSADPAADVERLLGIIGALPAGADSLSDAGILNPLSEIASWPEQNLTLVISLIRLFGALPVDAQNALRCLDLQRPALIAWKACRVWASSLAPTVAATAANSPFPWPWTCTTSTPIWPAPGNGAAPPAHVVAALHEALTIRRTDWFASPSISAAARTARPCSDGVAHPGHSRLVRQQPHSSADYRHLPCTKGRVISSRIL